jgi:hypothetical protein
MKVKKSAHELETMILVEVRKHPDWSHPERVCKQQLQTGSAPQLGGDIRDGRPAQYAERSYSVRGRAGFEIRSRLTWHRERSQDGPINSKTPLLFPRADREEKAASLSLSKMPRIHREATEGGAHGN